MKEADAARIQRAEARSSGGRAAKGGFAARAARTVPNGRKPRCNITTFGLIAVIQATNNLLLRESKLLLDLSLFANSNHVFFPFFIYSKH
jgi:hypothetical protein